MGRYSGHRVPDEYSKDWEVHSLGEYWNWWHLGYEDGYSQAKWEYGIPNTDTEDDQHIQKELDRLTKENENLRNLLAANVRVIKEELRKEIEEDKKQVRTETTYPT